MVDIGNEERGISLKDLKSLATECYNKYKIKAENDDYNDFEATVYMAVWYVHNIFIEREQHGEFWKTLSLTQQIDLILSNILARLCPFEVEYMTGWSKEYIENVYSIISDKEKFDAQLDAIFGKYFNFTFCSSRMYNHVYETALKAYTQLIKHG